METPARVWAVVPAAGAGRRMRDRIPKQYLMLRGRPVIAHTLQRLVDCDQVHAVVVAVSEDDVRWKSLEHAGGGRVLCTTGGVERADSVLAALRFTEARAGTGDLVLVHDAVRPCLHRSDLLRLIDAARSSPDGALLGVPASDTMKRVEDQRVHGTVPRRHLWHALTPQMFGLHALIDALEAARSRGLSVTDEAEAMERTGRHPRMVEGRSDNIKITRPGDLELAAFFLARAEEDACE